jgi:acetyltransferase-like isoleucine patch superfamily enzyme
MNVTQAPREPRRVEADRDVRLAYRAGNAQGPFALGPGARLRSGTVLYDGSRIGAGFETGHHVVVRENCVIGDDVSVWSGAVVDYGCRIGDRVKIHAGCYVAQYTVIEEDAFLAPGVRFANDLYPGDVESARVMTGPVVGRGAQLGVNVTVLPYVRIGPGALVGAGSVVTRDLPPGSLAYGSPARIHGHRDDVEPIQLRVRQDSSSPSGFGAARRRGHGA